MFLLNMEISHLQFWKKVGRMQSSSSLALSKSLFYIIKQLRTFHAIEKEQLLTVSRIPLNCKNKLRNFLLVHCISKTRFRKTHILKHPQNSVDIHKNLIKIVYNQVQEKINIVSRNGDTFPSGMHKPFGKSIFKRRNLPSSQLCNLLPHSREFSCLSFNQNYS